MLACSEFVLLAAKTRFGQDIRARANTADEKKLDALQYGSGTAK
jgi:hypothetical protein